MLPLLSVSEDQVRGGRILVVEDDKFILHFLARALGEAGYQVGCAQDGEAGWESLCADPFDLLITDHEMPRLRGLDLLRRVRAAPLPLPAILISGTVAPGVADLPPLLRPGAAIGKPFSLPELLTTVHTYLPPPQVPALPALA